MLHMNFNCNMCITNLVLLLELCTNMFGNHPFSTGCYLSKVLLSLQKLLLASS